MGRSGLTLKLSDSSALGGLLQSGSPGPASHCFDLAILSFSGTVITYLMVEVQKHKRGRHPCRPCLFHHISRCLRPSAFGALLPMREWTATRPLLSFWPQSAF